MESSIASLIAHADEGDRSAADRLFALLYDELRRIARAQKARSANDLTLGTTTLLHEAYLDLAGRERASFPDRGRFMAYAARAMRGLILNHIEAQRTRKRGGDVLFEPLDEAVTEHVARQPGLERLAAAIDELAARHPRLAQVVDLKFFCGFSFEEIARMWDLSERTVQRDWEKARIYLYDALGPAAP